MREKMVRTPEGDLKKWLQGPEFVAYFLEAQIESAQELLRAGVISNLTVGSTETKTVYTEVRMGEKILIYWHILGTYILLGRKQTAYRSELQLRIWRKR